MGDNGRCLCAMVPMLCGIGVDLAVNLFVSTPIYIITAIIAYAVAELVVVSIVVAQLMYDYKTC